MSMDDNSLPSFFVNMLFACIYYIYHAESSHLDAGRTIRLFLQYRTCCCKKILVTPSGLFQEESFVVLL